MKIKVTENAKHLKNLVVGKEYEVIQDKRHKVMIVDDNKGNYWLMSAFYEIVEEDKVEVKAEVGETRVDDGVSGIADTSDEPSDGERNEIPVSMGSGEVDKKPKKSKRRYDKKVDGNDGK